MNLILTPTIENFEDVRKYLSGIPNIDSGGCGIAALSMYRWLEKNKREQPKFICCYVDLGDYKKNLLYLGGDNDKLTAPNHCGIEYKNNFLDNYSVIPVWKYKGGSHLTNEQGMLDLINFGDWWSGKFERKNAKEISKRLEIDLSDVFT